MTTTTVRVSEQTHQSLKRLAQLTGEPISTVLAKAVKEYEDEARMSAFNEAFSRLRADPVAWDEELEERALWENTLLDGLEDDPWIDESSEVKSGSLTSTPPAVASREEHAPAS